MNDSSERLIDALAARARPVRRLAPPSLRAGRWIAAALVVVAASVAWLGLRHDLALRLAEPLFVLEWLAALATGTGAMLAAFHLSLPDRSPRWALAGLVPAVLWLGILGGGCLADALAVGMAAFAWETSLPCLRYIVVLGVPLTAVSLVMLRHAGPVRPFATMALASLGAAGLAGAGLSLVHHLDGAWLVLVWHGMATLVVVGFGVASGAVLRRLYARPAQ